MRRRTIHPTARSPAGVTLVEILVSIAIIGLLVAMTAPAVQRSRASARRMQCSSHLRQIGIATHVYADTHGRLPLDGPTGGLFFSILPELDQQAEHDRLEKLLQGTFADLTEAFTTAAKFEVYLCPDDTLATSSRAMSYAVNCGLFDNLPVQYAFGRGGHRWAEITDGMSQTALCSEIRSSPQIAPGSVPDPRYGKWFVRYSTNAGITSADLDTFESACISASQSTPPYVPYSATGYLWSSSIYNHVGLPNSPACESGGSIFSYPATSNHTGGVNVLLADGSVRFFASNGDMGVWRALGSRNGGEIESSSF